MAQLRYADVGINLTDAMFRGEYHGKSAHDPDLDQVIARARAVGCIKMMVTGSDVPESKHAMSIARQWPNTCYATVGIHPCSARSLVENPAGIDAVLAELRTLATDGVREGIVTAFGEFGLDYDRLFHADKVTQLRAFEAQLDLAVDLGLPLFLHSRAAAEDFERLLAPRLPRLPRRGLVHSFTGTRAEMERLVALGLDIGVNGCSLKTEENLDVVRAIPLAHLQIETDGPWCEIRPSHASAQHRDPTLATPKAVKKEKWEPDAMIKGRNEPCMITQVAAVVAAVKGVAVEEVCTAAWTNSILMFGLGEAESAG